MWVEQNALVLFAMCLSSRKYLMYLQCNTAFQDIFNGSKDFSSEIKSNKIFVWDYFNYDTTLCELYNWLKENQEEYWSFSWKLYNFKIHIC